MRGVHGETMISVLSAKACSFRDLLTAFSRLYKSSPTPPHCYLVYDLIYEPENTEIYVKLSENNTVESYVLTWRGTRWSALHIWGPSGCELLQSVKIEATRPINIELYSDSSELVECTTRRLRELGFKTTATRQFHDMETTEESFKPSENEHLAVRLTSSHVELFSEYVKSRNIDISTQEAYDLITKRTYYAVILDNKIVSAAAACIKLPEIHIVCDVYTRPEYRSRGYATAVTSAVTRRAVNSGAIAHLCVEVDNEPAIRVYRKLGYRVVGTRTWITAYP
jgi:ribosomal protein S18 acetylase RimI-like enzyme